MTLEDDGALTMAEMLAFEMVRLDGASLVRAEFDGKPCALVANIIDLDEGEEGNRVAVHPLAVILDDNLCGHLTHEGEPLMVMDEGVKAKVGLKYSEALNEG